MENKRTNLQNRSLHKLFDELAKTLTLHGLDMRRMLKPEVDIKWTKDSVKEYLWRPLQEAMTAKHSTTELTTKDIDDIFDTLCNHLGQKFGISLVFPSIETLMNEKNNT